MTSKEKRVVQEIWVLLSEQGVSGVMGEDLEFNFVQEGGLESFEILSFISELEESLDIVFTPKELVRCEVQTVGGLAALAESKLQSNK